MDVDRAGEPQNPLNLAARWVPSGFSVGGEKIADKESCLSAALSLRVPAA